MGATETRDDTGLEGAPAPSFDDYDLVRPLGQGGMGRVWLGHDRALDRPVAIKLIAPDHPALHRDRFLREARALARLSHPNVVSVYRIGEVRGVPYIAYEFVPGRSLDRLSRPLSWSTALSLALGLARGLEAAHASGILHRDIKPGNAVLSDRDVVKLLDFGLAKLVGDPGPISGPRSTESAPPASGIVAPRGVSGRPPTPLDPQATTLIMDPTSLDGLDEGAVLTQPGKVLGTPAYMAPELWRGEGATARTDLFALGLLLFELLVGRLPHIGSTWLETGRLVSRHDLPSIQVARPDVPDLFAAAIDRCARRDPAARPESVTELRETLEEAQRVLEGWSRPPIAGSIPCATTVPPSEGPRTVPASHEARRGDVRLPFQTFGQGPRDVVVLPGWGARPELLWDDPRSARFLARLGTIGRAVMIDERPGSVAAPTSPGSSPEDRVDDLLAVMTEARVHRPLVVALDEGRSTALALALLEPSHVGALVLHEGGRHGVGPHADVDLRPWLAMLAVPTLVLHGANEPTTGAEPRQLDAIPGARRFLLRGGDHPLHADDPRTWLGEVRSLLHHGADGASPPRALEVVVAVAGGAAHPFTRATEAIDAARAMLAFDPGIRLGIAAGPPGHHGARNACAMAQALAARAAAGQGLADEGVRQLSLSIAPALRSSENRGVYRV